jgi:hypothetical protein
VPDLVFLSPEWICQSVLGPALAPQSFIRHLNPVHGIVSAKDAYHVYSSVIASKRFTAQELCRIIFEVLCHLDLCFAVNPHESDIMKREYLFPSMVKDPPPPAGSPHAWREDSSLHRFGRRFACATTRDILSSALHPRLVVLLKLHFFKFPVVFSF